MYVTTRCSLSVVASKCKPEQNYTLFVHYFAVMAVLTDWQSESICVDGLANWEHQQLPTLRTYSTPATGNGYTYCHILDLHMQPRLSAYIRVSAACCHSNALASALYALWILLAFWHCAAGLIKLRSSSRCTLHSWEITVLVVLLNCKTT